MKKLWKYLSTIGLMLVAFLCLGVGLKASERAQAAKDCDVYINNGASYSMTGGSINSVTVYSGTFTMTSGTVNKVYIASSSTCVYNGGTMSGVEIANGGTFELKKEPTSLITITTQRISTSSGSNLGG